MHLLPTRLNLFGLKIRSRSISSVGQFCSRSNVELSMLEIDLDLLSLARF